jgi:hypothetical protein
MKSFVHRLHALSISVAVALCVVTFLVATPCEARGSTGIYVAPSSSWPTGAVLDGFALSLTPSKLTVHLGDPLWVTLELRNVSGKMQRIYYNVMLGKTSTISSTGYSFTIVDRKTARYVPTDPETSTDVPVTMHQLAPNTSVYLRYRLDTSYQFRTPGAYSAIINNMVSSNEGENYFVRATLQSNPIAITVLPRRGTAQASPLPIETPAVAVNLETDRPAYALGEPIFVRLSVRNITDDELHNIDTRLDAGAGSDLIIVDEEGNPTGPPHGFGPPYAWASGTPVLPRLAPHETAVFGFLNVTANIQGWESLRVSAPGAYAIATFLNRGWWLSSSPPVGVRVLTKAAAKSLPGSVLNDPKLNDSIRILLNEYHDVLVRSAAMIPGVRSTAETQDLYLQLRSAWAQGDDGRSIGDRLERLPGVGNPASPYVNVSANFLESLRHVSAAADVMLGLLPSNAPPPTPQPVYIPKCKLTGVTSELNVAEYFYDAVKSEMERGYASLGDSTSPPPVHSAPSNCS